MEFKEYYPNCGNVDCNYWEAGFCFGDICPHHPAYKPRTDTVPSPITSAFLCFSHSHCGMDCIGEDCQHYQKGDTSMPERLIKHWEEPSVLTHVGYYKRFTVELILVEDTSIREKPVMVWVWHITNKDIKQWPNVSLAGVAKDLETAKLDADNSLAKVIELLQEQTQ